MGDSTFSDGKNGDLDLTDDLGRHCLTFLDENGCSEVVATTRGKMRGVVQTGNTPFFEIEAEKPDGVISLLVKERPDGEKHLLAEISGLSVPSSAFGDFVHLLGATVGAASVTLFVTEGAGSTVPLVSPCVELWPLPAKTAH